MATKDVKVFCAENKDRLKMWMAGVRMAKVCLLTPLTHPTAPIYHTVNPACALTFTGFNVRSFHRLAAICESFVHDN